MLTDICQDLFDFIEERWSHGMSRSIIMTGLARIHASIAFCHSQILGNLRLNIYVYCS